MVQQEQEPRGQPEGQPVAQPVAEEQPQQPPRQQRRLFRNGVGRVIAAVIAAAAIGFAGWEVGRGGQDLPFGKEPVLPAAAREVAPTATPTARVVAKEPTKSAESRVARVPEPTPTATPTRPEVKLEKKGISLQAIILRPGETKIPNWGYGPWGVSGQEYPKIKPGERLPSGLSQSVTDFNGRNWVNQGSWCYPLPADAKEVRVTVQGDAPAEVSWDKENNQLCMVSNANISGRAPKAIDNTPSPLAGSSGISLVVEVR